jgi:hypothetical protein
MIMAFRAAACVAFVIGSVGLTAALAFIAHAQQAPQSRTIACEGPFGRSANHQDLVKAFGRNVVVQDVPGAEGEQLKASVIYPNDPRMRLEILWNDESALRDPLIRVNNQSSWSAPNGVRLKLVLADIEKMNGKPFKLSGFGWDYGGRATDWQGGALAKPQPGGCAVSTGFSHANNAPAAALSKVSGDSEFLSNNPNVRAVRPYVSEITIGYAQP